MTEEQKIDREIQILCASVVMRVREEMSCEHEAMVQERRGRRCALIYRVKKF